MPTMKRRSLILAVLMTLSGAPLANAEILINFHNTGLSAGGTGFVDVTMTVDTDTTLFDYSLKFQIDQPYAPSDSALVFVEHPLAYADVTNPHYVLLNASGNLAGDVPDFQGPSTEGLDWLISDYADPISVTLRTNTTYLLARLKVQHSYNESDIDPRGHAFTVSLAAGPDTFFSDGFRTIPYGPSFPSGVVTVPEPSSFVLLAGMTACVLAWLLRRRGCRRGHLRWRPGSSPA